MSFEILGVVHLLPMPGDVSGVDWGDVMAAAKSDAGALFDGGCNGLIIENFGSSPFFKGTPDDRLPAHQVAFIARVCADLRGRYPDKRLGVNCLRNDADAAIGIAAACELDFVRINIHIGAYVTDQGVIEGRAAHTVRMRAALNAENIEIFADVLVKHAHPLAPLDTSQAVKDTVLRGHASAVVVSGSGTGMPTSADLLEQVSTAAGEDAQVWIGSGFNPTTAPGLVAHAHGAIVGTYFKRDGLVCNPVDVRRVARLVEFVR